MSICHNMHKYLDPTPTAYAAIHRMVEGRPWRIMDNTNTSMNSSDQSGRMAGNWASQGSCRSSYTDGNPATGPPRRPALSRWTIASLRSALLRCAHLDSP